MRESIATRDIWQKGLDTLRATKRQTLIIGAAGLLLPQLALNFALDAQSAGVVAQLRSITENSTGKDVSFNELVAPVIAFGGTLGALGILLVAIGLAAYFALVHVAVLHHRGESAVSVGQAFKAGARLVLKRGLVIALAAFAAVFVGQALLLPAILGAIMALILPVIIVAEGKGGWTSLRDALGMRYVRGTVFSPWAVLFSLLSLGATLYVGIVMVAMLSEFVMRADEVLGASRETWSTTFGNMPFGPVYVAASIIESVLLVALLSIFPALTTALYFKVVGKRELARA